MVDYIMTVYIISIIRIMSINAITYMFMRIRSLNGSNGASIISIIRKNMALSISITSQNSMRHISTKHY